MKKILFTILSTFVLVFIAKAQPINFKWAKQMGGSSSRSAKGNAVALDKSGNVYSTGAFNGTVDFDPDSGKYELSPNTFYDDIFVSKLDANGKFVWAKKFTGNGVDKGYSIAVDKNGNVYTTGWFQGQVDFDPGPGTFSLSAYCSDPNGYNGYISKLDASGNFVWAKLISGGTKGVYTHGIDVDDSGNVYTTGEFDLTVDFDPGPGTKNLTSIGGSTLDIFILKLNAAGNFVWVKQLEGAYDQRAYGIKLDAARNIYITGELYSGVDFDPGPNVVSLSAQAGTDIFILKLNASGNYAWAKVMGGISDDIGLAITVDAQQNVYTTGHFGVNADFDPGAGKFILTSTDNADFDIFISKLNVAGDFVWAKRIGAAKSDQGTSLTVDASRNIYMTGTFQSTVDFDPGAGTTELTAASGNDIFLTKFSEAGNMLWAKSFDGVMGDRGPALTLNTAGDVYTVGSFSALVDFDPDATGVYELTSFSLSDIFVHKMGQPSFAVDAIAYNKHLTVYPNPNKGVFKIDYPVEYNDLSLEIYNAVGELIYNEKYKELSIDLRSYPDGIYLAVLKSNSAIIDSKKIIIQ